AERDQEGERRGRAARGDGKSQGCLGGSRRSVAPPPRGTPATTVGRTHPRRRVPCFPPRLRNAPASLRGNGVARCSPCSMKPAIFARMRGLTPTCLLLALATGCGAETPAPAAPTSEPAAETPGGVPSWVPAPTPQQEA